MKRSNRFFLLVCILFMAAGCATGHSKRQILDSGSQVELRSYQTRTYDTTDKVRVLRSVMATLQDLGFVIDKADDVVGVVSATKLDGYAMSMSVSVRPSGEQMTVRANAQYNLKAIEQPGPYQDFFTALDKGLFLDRNMLADELPTGSAPAGGSASLVTEPQVTASATAAGSVYDYYGEAEEEINAATYDKNLWARALVVAEGDEQKRKAKYIELRAEQLFSESGAALAITSQARQSGTSIKPEASSQSLAAAIGPTTSEPSATEFSSDISGTWIADITTNKEKVFKKIPAKIEFTIEQEGNRISGVNSDYNLKVTGTLNGSRIDFHVEPHRINNFQKQQGVWEISPDGTKLDGSWKIVNMAAAGQWNMSRAGVPTVTGTSIATENSTRTRPTSRDLTGTYYSQISGSYKHDNVRSLSIEQNGDRITGQSPGKEWEIEGVVEGSTVRFKWFNKSNKGKGKFSIDARGNLTGEYHGDSWGQGEWKLTRIN